MWFNPINSLIERVPFSSNRPASMVLNGLVGLGVSVLIILAGYVLQTLIYQANGAISVYQPLFRSLGDWGAWAPTAPLHRVLWFLVAIVVLLLLIELALYWAYRLAHSAAIDFESAWIDRLRNHSAQLARAKTLSAQESELVDCLEYHLPRVRSVLAKYWQMFPRHLVQFLSCLACAMLIHLQFTLLAIIATAILVLSFQFLDRRRRTHLPVIRENASRNRTGVVSMILRGPLLDAVHDQGDLQNRFSDQLNLYRQDAVRSLSSSAWKTPVVMLFMGILLCLLIFITSIQMVQKNLQLPAAFAFLSCLAAAIFSSRRLLHVHRDCRQVSSAVDQLQRYMALSSGTYDEKQMGNFAGSCRLASLEHVTLQDSRGRKLLVDVSVQLEAGKLIGVVSTQPLESRALVEMLMGFGQPTSGRLLLDGSLVTDIKPSSLTKSAHWVAADGAILAGTLLENLRADRHTALQSLSNSSVSDLLARLPQGLDTVVSSDDDRFQEDDAFRLGLARARLSRASILVVDEPFSTVSAAAELGTLKAVKELVSPNRLTIVLPKRLATLRQCDNLIFIHETKLLDTGTHAEIIHRNDLYRHLNYLRFNPFGIGRSPD